MISDPLISIVIATYYRPDFLALLLDALLLQMFPALGFEIIVVDNCPESDPNVQMICGKRKYSNMNVQYIHQPKPGPSNARNLGISVARSPWIGFIDDDAIPPENWVNDALTCIEFSGANIIGGPFYPFYKSTPPAWFRDEYGSGCLEGQAGFLKVDKQIFGNNMFWKRELLMNLGGFSPLHGYLGKKEIYGEETELQRRAIKSGARVWYAPALAVRHYFPKERMRVGWFFSSGYRHGQSKARIYFQDWRAQDPRPVSRQILSQFRGVIVNLSNVIGSMLTLPFRPRTKYPHWQNYAVECIRPCIGELGLSVKMLELYFSREGKS
jgi:glycosyltransferase involved in cell wall biosynthesis